MHIDSNTCMLDPYVSFSSLNFLPLHTTLSSLHFPIHLSSSKAYNQRLPHQATDEISVRRAHHAVEGYAVPQESMIPEQIRFA